MPNTRLNKSANKPDDSDRSVVQHQYLSEDEFLSRFQPIPNPLDETAGFDFGEGGCVFDTGGQDLEFVRTQPPEKVWTVVDGDDGLEITEGMHFVNRLGYLVTRHPCPKNTFISVDLEG